MDDIKHGDMSNILEMEIWRDRLNKRCENCKSWERWPSGNNGWCKVNERYIGMGRDVDIVVETNSDFVCENWRRKIQP